MSTFLGSYRPCTPFPFLASYGKGFLVLDARGAVHVLLPAKALRFAGSFCWETRTRT